MQRDKHSKVQAVPVLITDIIIDRDERQRKELVPVDELAKSMDTYGLLNPIILKKQTLIAGECRVRAAQLLGWTHILARQFNKLTRIEQRRVEFDENIKRTDLSWQDQAVALKQIHDDYKKENGKDWTLKQTAEKHGQSIGYVSRNVVVAEALIDNHERVKNSPTLQSARNILVREEERIVDNE